MEVLKSAEVAVLDDKHRTKLKQVINEILSAHGLQEVGLPETEDTRELGVTTTTNLSQALNMLASQKNPREHYGDFREQAKKSGYTNEDIESALAKMDKTLGYK